MNTQSLETIMETAVRAAGIKVQDRVVVVPSLPDAQKYMIINRDGQHQLLDKPEPRRDHVLLSSQEVIAFAVYMKQLGMAPVIWIDSDKIQVTDDGNRLLGSRATYTFELTRQMKLVKSLELSPDGRAEPKSFDQAALLRMLKIDLLESFHSDDHRRGLISLLRKVRAQQSRAIGNGSGSYDASMIDDAGASIEWPDYLNLDIRIFEDAAIKEAQPIRIAFDADPHSKTFALQTLSADVDAAMLTVQDLISEVIRSEVNSAEIPVFIGMNSR